MNNLLRRLRRIGRRWLAAGASLVAINGPAAMLVLEATADTELRETAPDSVFPGATIVSGGLGVHVANETRRGLVRFDLSAVPANAVVQSATLTLTIVRVPQDPGHGDFELRPLLVPWNENEATWNSRRTGVPWEVPGALGDADSAAAPSGAAAIPGTGELEFAGPEVQATVQQWVREEASNHGWLFRNQAEQTLRTARHFASREAAEVATRPRLTVTYELPPQLGAVNRDGDDLVFEFAGSAGRAYQLQTRTDLGSGDWQDVRMIGPLVEDETVTMREPLITGESGRFFRVQVEEGAE